MDYQKNSKIILLSAMAGDRAFISIILSASI